MLATSSLMVVVALFLDHRSPRPQPRSLTAAAPDGAALGWAGAVAPMAPEIWDSGPITVPMQAATPPSAAAASPAPAAASIASSDLAETATPHRLDGPRDLGDDLHHSHSWREWRGREQRWREPWWIDRWTIRSRQRPKGKRWSEGWEDSSPRRLSDVFSVEVGPGRGDTPVAARRRDIDRANPFTP
ncbi:MAG: hypothetical protein ABJA82_01575 [Myxococcales bacterium]